MVIVIDPGHGGPDPGAVAGGIKEKDINFSVAKLVQKNLSALLPDAVTLLTVTPETIDRKAYELKSRVELANSQRAFCYVSIHCNAATNPQANGLETFYYPNSARGEQLAVTLHRNIMEKIRLNDRGVKSNGRLYVLKHTKMPAALIELGFLTNESDRRILADPSYQSKYALAIADGIVEFIKDAVKA